MSYGIDLRPPAPIYSAPFLSPPRVSDAEAAAGAAGPALGRLYFDGGPSWVIDAAASRNTPTNGSASSGDGDGSGSGSTSSGGSVLHWSSPSASGLPTVTLHSLTLCSARLLPERRPLPALIDTASSCLSLPARVFDAVESWLPVECLAGPVATMGLGRSSRLCRYLYATQQQATALATPLPTLELTVTQPTAAATGTDNGGSSSGSGGGGDGGGSSDGTNTSTNEKIFLPLSSLLMPLSATGIISTRASLESRRQALPRRAGLLYGDWAPSTPVLCLVRSEEPHARIGAMPLAAMYAQVELRGGVTRVGLANKAAFARENTQCRPREVCQGMEWTPTGMNKCFTPNCYSFLFVELTDDGKSCKVDEFFYVVLSFIVILFVVVEAGSLFWAEGLSRRVYRTATLLQSFATATASSGSSSNSGGNANSGASGWFVAVPDVTTGQDTAAAEVAAVAEAAAAEARYTTAALEYCAGEADAGTGGGTGGGEANSPLVGAATPGGGAGAGAGASRRGGAGAGPGGRTGAGSAGGAAAGGQVVRARPGRGAPYI